ncbi:MAG: hypothetical protein GX952_07935, partial [Firmicutes bacterium]|nr:hypothetical protein [Bacillota bacterium]
IMPISIKETLDETLDSGHFQMITTDSEQIKPFTKSKLVINGKESYWFANSTATVLNSKKGTYKHDVYLIEPTKILERYILGTRTFSSGSSYFETNKELIRLILETCYPTRASDTFGEQNPLFEFFLPGTENRAFNQKAKEYFFPEQTTLFEALESIGKSMNAFPRLKTFGNKPYSTGNKSVISFDFFDNTEQYNLNENNVFYEQLSNDINMYANSLESKVSNAVNTKTPSYLLTDEHGTTIRSESVRIVEDSAEIFLDKPIHEIKRVWLKNTAETTVNADTTLGGRDLRPTQKIDITNFVFEKSEWDLLPKEDTTDNFPTYGGLQIGSYGSLYYTRGQRSIKNIFKYHDNWVQKGGTSIMQVLLYAIRYGDWNYLFANILNTPGTPFPADEIINIYRLDTTNENYKNLEFIVEYIPLDNVLIKTYKDKHKSAEMRTNTLIYNQSANIVDIEHYGKNLRKTIEKIGNDGLSIAFTDKSNVIPTTGEKIGDYYISVVDLELYKTHNKIKLELTKHNHKIADSVGIDSQLRLFNIPNDNHVSERIIHLETFCFLDKDNKSNEGDLKQDAKRAIMEAVTNYGNRRITRPPMAIIGVNNKEYLKPINYFELSNSSLLSFGFEHNSVAGYQRVGPKEENKKTVLYTNDKGEVFDCEIDIKSAWVSNGSYNPDLLPINTFTSFSRELLSLGIKNLKKDAREIIKFNYQIHYLSNNPDIFIGDNFVENVDLFSNKITDRILWLAISDK